jgi:large subunit ribosomal protein L10e
MGSPKKEFNAQFSLVARNTCHIRHSALEAARIGSNRHMQKNIQVANYHLRIRVHPHHVLRENRMMAFAGADRMQNGMRQSFGKPIDMAARVKSGQALITIRTDGKHYRFVIGALKRASRKLPTPCDIVIESGHEHVKH